MHRVMSARFRRAFPLAGFVAAWLTSLAVAQVDLDACRWIEADGRTLVLYAAPWTDPDGNAGIERRIVDAETGVISPLFDHVAAASSLERLLVKPIVPAALPIEALDVRTGGESIELIALVVEWPAPLRIGADGRVSEATTAEASALSRPLLSQRVAAENRARPASGSGRSTALHFVNGTEQPVRLLWVSGDRVVPYATLQPGARHRQHTFAGHLWQVVDEGGASHGFVVGEDEPRLVPVAQIAVPEEPDAPSPPRGRRGEGVRSPDGQFVATIEEGVLVLRNDDGKIATRLASDDASAPFVPPLHWSPRGDRLVIFRRESGEGRRVPLVDVAPRDQIQPRLRSIPYAKPGDRLEVLRPRLVAIDADSHAGGVDARIVTIDESPMPEPWSIDRLHWRPDGTAFEVLYNQRGHAVLRLIAVDATTGSSRAIIEERSPTFIDYAGKLFLHRLDGTHSESSNALLWTSERDGWNHLYLFDAESGALRRQLTSGPWVVRGIERVDEASGVVWCRVSGIHPGRDPSHVHLARVPLTGDAPLVVTEGDGTHRWRWSPGGRHLLVEWSRVDRSPTIELRSATDGRLVATLASGAEPSATARIERFAAKGRDGATDIWGVLVRPSNFDPGTRYPVLECVYAGPHGAHAPVAHGSTRGLEEMADAGFVVVMIDGMGTNHGGKAFQDVAWKNLKDAGFPDRIAWLKAAAATRPWMDLERVGIYGGSAGGQSAMRALLDHHDVYSVAVADCGCHDNRMDKVWWNELWMGWPVDDSYAASSNVVDAHKLRGQLLLIVGALDENVDPASTMQAVDALIRADKDFELLVIPSAGHGAAETPYGKRRRLEFLKRHLGEPTDGLGEADRIP